MLEDKIGKHFIRAIECLNEREQIENKSDLVYLVLN